MKEGPAGSFEVVINGRTVFSGLDEGRYPEAGEIVRLVKETFAPAGPRKEGGNTK